MAAELKGTTNVRRGFAAMDRAKQREIARKGGANVPRDKRSFAQNRQLAAEAGRKGGQSVAAQDRSFSQNRELAAEAGRKGGRSAQSRHNGGKSAQVSGSSETEQASDDKGGSGTS